MPAKRTLLFILCGLFFLRRRSRRLFPATSTSLHQPAAAQLPHRHLYVHVMVSIKSIADPTAMASSQPPSIYPASLYSSYSSPYPTYSSRNGSFERLVPKKPLVPKTNLRYSGPRTTAIPSRQSKGPANRNRMASNGIPIPNEQKKSYGIGGAGNIRMFPFVSIYDFGPGNEM
jgi:hypothetical protein